MAKKTTIVIVSVVFLVVATGYSLAVANLYVDRHLAIPSGNYAEDLAGEYDVVDKSQYRVPEVFQSDRLSIHDDGNGRIKIVASAVRTLTLDQGRDGLYFSQNFTPSGPWILPGIARNWNEGRLRKSKDGVVIEGYMLEKGLALFVFPFKDVAPWKIELRSSTKEASK